MSSPTSCNIGLYSEKIWVVVRYTKIFCVSIDAHGIKEIQEKSCSTLINVNNNPVNIYVVHLQFRDYPLDFENHCLSNNQFYNLVTGFSSESCKKNGPKVAFVQVCRKPGKQ